MKQKVLAITAVLNALKVTNVGQPICDKLQTSDPEVILEVYN